MILYSSGGLHLFCKSAIKGNKYLSSFYWDKNVEKIKQAYEVSGEKMFLDSGGYTARVQGKPIDIKTYCDFVEKYQHLFHICANLDIGTHEEQIANQKLLESRVKIPVLPVFHPEEYFDKKKREWFDVEMQKRDIVAIGGLVGGSGINYVDELGDKGYFDWIFHRALKYKTKVHGFGITTVPTLIKYPFYSVDSSTWLAGARFGTLFYWNPVKMKFDSTSTKKVVKSKMVKNVSEIKLIEKDNVAILKNNLKAMYDMEKFVTSLWAKRGIKWD